MKQDVHVNAEQLLSAVPSTLLVPLVARARGATLFPWLDPGDTQAQQVLQNLSSQVMALLQDRPSVLSVLWRTQLIKQIGRGFFTH
jgi:hypothetical protein